MDLHFTDAIADADEREAIDEILGRPDSAWSGGERDGLSSRQSKGGRAVRNQRHWLLPVLHAVQDRAGWVSPGALNYLCSRLTIPPADAYGVASFYALLSTEPQAPIVVHVCDDIACQTRGATDACAMLEGACNPSSEPYGDTTITWKRSPCLGLCERAPAALFQCAGAGRYHFTVAPIAAEELLAVLRGASQPRPRLEAGPAASTSSSDDTAGRRTAKLAPCVPSSSHPPGPGQSASTPQTPSPALRLLARVGVVDPASLDDYRATGGYSALRRALDIGPASVIRELADAKLTGRGGAAFPTSLKWKAVAEATARPHYIVCNADESEPGTFKDRVLMEEDPFALIEAMTIAGLACGADYGYIYIRGEYPEATRRLHSAIEQARTRGLLGGDVMARGITFDIEIRRGGGAYICGEETALLNSIEGRRGEPRNKPPFPVHVGLFGKPTAVNNVETLLNVLPILSESGRDYAMTGSANSTGTRLFCVSGCVARPGVYEVPYGATLGELVELAGGVWKGRGLQAILLGGAAGVFVRPDELGITLTLEGARAADATLGSGVILVFDDTVDMRAILLRIAAFFRDESCGQCVPCRIGTVRQEEALLRLLSGRHTGGTEVALLGELEQAMKDASICGLGHTASCAILSAIHRLGMFKGGQL